MKMSLSGSLPRVYLSVTFVGVYLFLFIIFKRLTLVSKRALIEIGCVVTSLVVGRWLVGRWSLVGWLSRACTVAKRCILGL